MNLLEHINSKITEEGHPEVRPIKDIMRDFEKTLKHDLSRMTRTVITDIFLDEPRQRTWNYMYFSSRLTQYGIEFDGPGSGTLVPGDSEMMLVLRDVNQRNKPIVLQRTYESGDSARFHLVPMLRAIEKYEKLTF